MQFVKKAVITAAGRGTRQYPATSTIQKEMLPLVDVDGITKPTIQIICEEAIQSGIEEICIVTNPRDDEQLKQHFRPIPEDQMASFKGKDWALQQNETLRDLENRITFVQQLTQEGYGHAVYQAKEFAGDDPFLLMLGDHVYVSHTNKRCARQIMDVYAERQCSVSSVARTPSNLLHLFGTIAGERVSTDPNVYEVSCIKEKPSIPFAMENLRVKGLPEDDYLCFFGLHVFTSDIFDALDYHIRNNIRERDEFQLTSAQEYVRQHNAYVACEVAGVRYDMGVPFGYIESQMGLALSSPFRDDLLAAMNRIIQQTPPNSSGT